MKKTRTGTVVSDKMDKTITVQVDRMVAHPQYGKRYRVSKKFAVHDEANSAKMGDTVTITETRPMSKRKSWMLTSIDKRAEGATIELADTPVLEATEEKEA